MYASLHQLASKQLTVCHCGHH